MPAKIAPTAKVTLVAISALRVRRLRWLASSRSTSNQCSCEVWLGAMATIEAEGLASASAIAEVCCADAGPAGQHTAARTRVAAIDARFMA